MKNAELAEYLHEEIHGGASISDIIHILNTCPAPKAIEVEALKREMHDRFSETRMEYRDIDMIIDHLNSRGLFGQVDQAAVDALKFAAEIFRDYENIHLSKNPPDRAKAERNGEYAYKMECAIERLQTRQQEKTDE